jgi:peptidase M28-like protein
LRRVASVVFVLALAGAGCTREPGVFSEQNARAHVGMLAGTIGPRPVGTDANARARAYVIDQLKLAGYQVRVQEVDAQRPELGRTAHVSNIVAALDGHRSEAIGLVSHYDTAPESPGGGDDGVGVAVSLEAARVLGAQRDRQWSIFVLVTDGEEAGLMGAAGLVKDREVKSRLRAYINVESIGSRGTAMLFQAGPANGWITGAWSRHAPHPRGASFAGEIYKRLPNDTDFTIFGGENIPGLNFAAIGDSYAYHTVRDTAERLSPETLRNTGENIVGTALALDQMDITRRSRWDGVFFDIGATSAISYSVIVGWILSALSIPLGILASVRIIREALRLGGIGRWLFTAAWTAVAVGAAVASMIGVTWGLRTAGAVYHPWYAHPDRMFLLMLITAATVGWAISRAGVWFSPSVRGARHPLVTWTLALPIWVLLAAAMLWLAPGAAFMWTLPLLIASALLIAVRTLNAVAVRALSVVVLALSGTLWLRNAVELLRFVVAIFGRLPVITPAYVYAAVITATALMIVPPLIAAMVPPRPASRPSLVTAALLAIAAVAGGFAYAAPAYTYDRPLRRQVRALQEPGQDTATWELASVEPGLDLAAGASAGWTLQSVPTQTSIPWGRLPQPFVFRTTGPSLGAPPAEVPYFTVASFPGGVEMTATVVPQRPGLAVSFVLPPGITPSQTNLPGAMRLGQWTATFVAPTPVVGVTWHASFGAVDPQRLRALRVAVTQTAPDLPPWLPQERAVWTSAFTWVLAAARPPIEPVAPLR